MCVGRDVADLEPQRERDTLVGHHEPVVRHVEDRHGGGDVLDAHTRERRPVGTG